MLSIMPNSRAAHIGIEAIRKCLQNGETATEFGTASELAEAVELLRQMKKAEELRQFETCGSEAEEELAEIFENLREIHIAQGRVWELTVPMWKTIRNAMYLRTGICLTKSVIVRRYYDYTRTDSTGQNPSGSTARAVLDGLTGLYKEIQDVRGGN